VRWKEPPIDQPAHPFEDVFFLEIECPGCDNTTTCEVIELFHTGVVVTCPTCEQEVTVELI